MNPNQMIPPFQVVTRSRRATNAQGQQQQQSGNEGTTSTYNPYEALKRFLSKYRPFSSNSNSNANADGSPSKRNPLLLVSARSYGQDVEFSVIDERFAQRFVRNGRFD